MMKWFKSLWAWWTVPEDADELAPYRRALGTLISKVFREETEVWEVTLWGCSTKNLGEIGDWKVTVERLR